MNAKDRRIKELETIVAAQAKLIEELLVRIDELERRLALNSGNSSKPPSSDGLRKTSKNRSLRETDSKKFGGQIDHKGDTLETVERQEINVVVRKQITAHKALIKVCRCGEKNTGVMPERMKAPVQYGAHVRAMSVYFTNQFVTKNRISEIFRDLFQLSISDTILMAFDEECAEKLSPFNKAVLEAIKKADVKHLDETGYAHHKENAVGSCYQHRVANALSN